MLTLEVTKQQYNIARAVKHCALLVAQWSDGFAGQWHWPVPAVRVIEGCQYKVVGGLVKRLRSTRLCRKVGRVNSA